MRAIWKGSVSFGLVNIPIALYPATRREELRFRLLRKSDLSPVNYQRVAEVDGKEVEWDDIVKGYEYEKGKFAVLDEEDFKRVDVEATQTVDIVDFVELEEINPMFFQKPYFLEPQKGGDKAYSLLRETLKKTGKAGIAKVVIRTKEHLAAVRPHEKLLVLHLLHFADELADPDKLHAPEGENISKKELEVACALVDSQTVEWKPENYEDDYRSALVRMIEEKIRSGGKAAPSAPARKGRAAGEVVDLVQVLQQSIRSSRKESGPKKAKPRRKRKSPAASRGRKRQTA